MVDKIITHYGELHPLNLYIEKYGYSKVGFAKKIPCSYSLPGMWINGTANPSYKMAQRIASITNNEVPISVFYPNEDTTTYKEDFEE
jgi:hypothetical protein